MGDFIYFSDGTGIEPHGSSNNEPTRVPLQAAVVREILIVFTVVIFL